MGINKVLCGQGDAVQSSSSCSRDLKCPHHVAADSLQPGLVSRQRHRLSLVELLYKLSLWALDHNNISVNNTDSAAVIPSDLIPSVWLHNSEKKKTDRISHKILHVWNLRGKKKLFLIFMSNMVSDGILHQKRQEHTHPSVTTWSSTCITWQTFRNPRAKTSNLSWMCST